MPRVARKGDCGRGTPRVGKVGDPKPRGRRRGRGRGRGVMNRLGDDMLRRVGAL